MSTQFTLEEVDRDGAVQEAIDKVSGDTRAAFLTKAVVATGGLIGGGAVLGALAKPAGAATSNDVAIANFALTLEYLEASFYAQAVSSGALSGRTAAFAKEVANHEAQHVAALKKVLGSAAVAKPSFNFQGTTENQAKFEKTAMVLEDEGVAAYKGQAGNDRLHRHPERGARDPQRRGAPCLVDPSHPRRLACSGGVRSAEDDAAGPRGREGHRVHGGGTGHEDVGEVSGHSPAELQAEQAGRRHCCRPPRRSGVRRLRRVRLRP